MNEEPVRPANQGWTEYRADPVRAALRARLNGLLRPAGFRVDAVLTLFHERHETVAIDVWDRGTKTDDVPPPEHDLLWTEEQDISTSHEDGLSTNGVADLIRSAFDRYSREVSRR